MEGMAPRSFLGTVGFFLTIAVVLVGGLQVYESHITDII
jgi:hypothetical protein